MTSRTKISAINFHNQLIVDRGVENATGFSEDGQTVRFSVIKRCLDRLNNFPNVKILDYGCADCGLYASLDFKSPYMGIDINPKFIAFAKKRWSEDVREGHVQLKVGTALEARTQAAIVLFKPTVIVASGVFCLKGEKENFRELIRILYQLSGKMFVFNVLTVEGNDRPLNDIALVPWKVADVLKVIAYCQCTSWEIIRSYTNNDMTVVMRKHWTGAA